MFLEDGEYDQCCKYAFDSWTQLIYDHTSDWKMSNHVTSRTKCSLLITFVWHSIDVLYLYVDYILYYDSHVILLSDHLVILYYFVNVYISNYTTIYSLFILPHCFLLVVSIDLNIFLEIWITLSKHIVKLTNWRCYYFNKLIIKALMALKEQVCSYGQTIILPVTPPLACALSLRRHLLQYLKINFSPYIYAVHKPC